MTESETALRPRERLLGYDFARCLAIVGMVLINFPIFLATLEGEAGGLLAWIANIHYGRAAALFVTLAGAGVALMTQGANLWAVRRTLLLRALFLFVLGNALFLVWRIDILHFYAFYLAIAALLLITLPRWALLAGIVLIAIATVAMNIIWPDIENTLDVSTAWPPDGGAERPSYYSVQGMAQNVFISGVHPVMPWIAFLMAGIWVGKHDLTDVPTRQRMLAIGAMLGVGMPLLSVLLEHAPLYGFAPAEMMLFLGVLHAPSPLYLFAAIGTSIFVIALSQIITAHWGGARAVRAMVHAGQMALTLYLTHALLGVVIPQDVFGAPRFPLAWVLGYALAFSLAIITLAHLYRLRFKRGPIESVMRAIAGTPEEREHVERARLPAPAPYWLPVAGIGVVVLLALQVAGAPPRLACAEASANGARNGGFISLLCPEQVFAVRVTERADVTLETMSNRDLVLELYNGDERIGFNDDGGVGVNARLTVTLDPGTYRLVARPYESAVGAFLLLRADAAPTVRELGPNQICSDSYATARDGECDDGGPNSLYSVCDFGSDCADCGVRNMSDMQSMLNADGQLCTNSCGSANDGECDDGGPNSLYSICALGSDCADCGPRAPPMTPAPR